MKKSALYLLFLIVLFLSPSDIYSQSVSYKITGTITIGGETRWDYLAIDTLYHRLYVSHSTKVHVIDLSSNKVIGEISNLHGVHGIAFAPEFNKGFISCGRDNSVTVFDLKTFKATGRISIPGKNPDAIVYEPYTKRIFTFNGGSSNATAIEAKTNKIAGTIALSGAPEFAQSDLKGRMFVNLEDKNAIEVFDPKTLKVIATWSILPCETPTGMSIDRENNRIFTSGRNKLLAVLDANSGKVIQTLPIGGGVDACVFDKADHLIFTSNGEGNITIIKAQSPDEYKVLENIPTAQGARTMAFDEKTRRIYSLAAIPENIAPENDTKNAIKTFSVLVIDRK